MYVYIYVYMFSNKYIQLVFRIHLEFVFDLYFNIHLRWSGIT